MHTKEFTGASPAPPQNDIEYGELSRFIHILRRDASLKEFENSL